MPVIFRTGGGGSALNFKVKAYSELPETGSENEIAVITDTPITGYVLQAEEPTTSGTASDTLTWDGNADGLEAVGTFVKVASCTLTVADFANGCSVSLSDGTVLTCTKADIEEMGGMIAISSLAFYIPVDGFDVGEENPVSKGLYFNSEEREGIYVASITINGYDGFPATIPDGHVWIEVTTESEVPFYADKKQTVKLYPKAVKQYSGGWKNMNAFIYQGGEWVAFSSSWLGQLYVEGNEYTDVTGGWAYHKGGSVTLESTYMKVNGEGTSGQYSNAITQKSVDLTNYSTITLSVSSVKESDVNAVFHIGVTSSNSTDNYFANKANGSFAASQSTMDLTGKVLTLDITDVKGSYYVIVAARHGSMNVTSIIAS